MPTLDVTTVRFQDNAGIRNRRVGQYTGPAAYVAGGDPLTPEDLNLSEIEFLHFEPPIDATPACRLCTYDHVNHTVIWFDLAGAEIAGGVDLSTFSARFEAIGK